MDKPKIEPIIADWIETKFGIEIKIRYGTVHDPLLVCGQWIIARFYKTKIESGSWVNPKDLYMVDIGDPELFAKLETLVQTRINEIVRDNGYAGMIALVNYDTKP